MSQKTRTKTYFELISQDEKTVQKESLKLKAQEAGLELNREIFDLTVKIKAQETVLTGLQRRIPYSVGAEYNATKILVELEERLEFAKAVKEDRFSDAGI